MGFYLFYFISTHYKKKHTKSCYKINIIETTINEEEKNQERFYFIFQPLCALITSKNS